MDKIVVLHVREVSFLTQLRVVDLVAEAASLLSVCVSVCAVGTSIGLPLSNLSLMTSLTESVLLISSSHT